MRKVPTALLAVLLLLLDPSYAYGYIGPGAGFAFIGSAFTFFLTLLLGVATVFLWPAEWALRRYKRSKLKHPPKFRRVIIVGLDGLEPTLVDRYMKEGNLPNLTALKESGGYRRLKTTLPALSPVAWSTFQTGVNPGAHNIFDFLTLDRRAYLPMLSSTEVKKRKNILGRERDVVHITRKCEPFWKTLGRYGIFSNVLRVPISYPPERFFGNVLSAMCTPDLKGTQGSFTYFSIFGADGLKGDATGGERREFIKDAEGKFSGFIDGPPNTRSGKKSGFSRASFTLTIKGEESAELEINGKKTAISLNRISEWVEIDFKVGRRTVSGIARFCLRKGGKEPELYVSPVNAHPERPAFRISEPSFFSAWLSRRLGLFGTLGLMEDTWGRNEYAIDDERFLEQTYLTHAEREGMFFELLKRTKEGLCIAVFDASDRIQHMFWRYIDPNHPSPKENSPKMKDVIPDMYRKMDDLVGRVLEKVQPKDLLIVMSDHGFSSFRRCVNLNTWLLQNGYLKLKEGAEESLDYLKSVDWSRTKAFAVGLAGVYLNLEGRERYGVVKEDEAKRLKLEISGKLANLCDPIDSKKAVSRVFDSEDEYFGLYANEAPDLIIGWEEGFRVSWDSVTGKIEKEVFSDNLKAWSGDHHIDPKKVPGVIFSNMPIKESEPHIADLAPTILDLFGVEVPKYMEGRLGII